MICILAEKFKMKKNIYAYDTFGTGHSVYSDYDTDLKNNSKISNREHKYKEGFFPSEENVKENLQKLTVKSEFMPKFIKGKVEETLYIKENLPNKIALARIDTDLYDSTKHELEVFYPRISKGGVLQINGYGVGEGVKKAVDEYFKNKQVWMHRVDFGCRVMIKE